MLIDDYIAALPADSTPGARRARLSLSRRVMEIQGYIGQPLDLSSSAWSVAAQTLPRLTEDQLAHVRRTGDAGPFLPSHA